MSGRIGAVKTLGIGWVAPLALPSAPMIETVGREAIAKISAVWLFKSLTAGVDGEEAHLWLVGCLLKSSTTPGQDPQLFQGFLPSPTLRLSPRFIQPARLLGSGRPGLRSRVVLPGARRPKRKPEPAATVKVLTVELKLL
ncbi:hypothetical protein PpBr36_01621 [Pyricularia pennisetigena]|uniref:hypothetical protein n=1 Tax=Pyricularia pennisetigena TaxID=1578925 RepID=UPI00114DA5C9|nr:hypothetical protein PpBr36_01621 [Pyricularia pennisetigena]TLS27966.1 hypothetical protein PpBr36_01621 [Pyricularia pennisetigena]